LKMHMPTCESTFCTHSYGYKLFWGLEMMDFYVCYRHVPRRVYILQLTYTSWSPLLPAHTHVCRYGSVQVCPHVPPSFTFKFIERCSKMSTSPPYPHAKQPDCFAIGKLLLTLFHAHTWHAHASTKLMCADRQIRPCQFACVASHLRPASFSLHKRQ
jgi:hypothetical protein